MCCRCSRTSRPDSSRVGDLLVGAAARHQPQHVDLRGAEPARTGGAVPLIALAGGRQHRLDGLAVQVPRLGFLAQRGRHLAGRDRLPVRPRLAHRLVHVGDRQQPRPRRQRRRRHLLVAGAVDALVIQRPQRAKRASSGGRASTCPVYFVCIRTRSHSASDSGPSFSQTRGRHTGAADVVHPARPTEFLDGGGRAPSARRRGPPARRRPPSARACTRTGDARTRPSPAARRRAARRPGTRAPPAPSRWRRPRAARRRARPAAWRPARASPGPAPDPARVPPVRLSMALTTSSPVLAAPRSRTAVKNSCASSATCTTRAASASPSPRRRFGPPLPSQRSKACPSAWRTRATQPSSAANPCATSQRASTPAARRGSLHHHLREQLSPAHGAGPLPQVVRERANHLGAPPVVDQRQPATAGELIPAQRGGGGRRLSRAARVAQQRDLIDVLGSRGLNPAAAPSRIATIAVRKALSSGRPMPRSAANESAASSSERRIGGNGAGEPTSAECDERDTAPPHYSITGSRR